MLAKDPNASTDPSAPPVKERRRLSVNNCRTRRPRPAPMDSRSAISLWRTEARASRRDRKSTRLNSSHGYISYAVFCLKKKDLSYALLPWSSKLRNGEAFRKAYGDKVGFHYYEDEDCGIFWSNDPKTTIGAMARAIGVLELEDEMARVKEFYRKAKVWR